MTVVPATRRQPVELIGHRRQGHGTGVLEETVGDEDSRTEQFDPGQVRRTPSSTTASPAAAAAAVRAAIAPRRTRARGAGPRDRASASEPATSRCSTDQRTGAPGSLVATSNGRLPRGMPLTRCGPIRISPPCGLNRPQSAAAPSTAARRRPDQRDVRVLRHVERNVERA